MKKLMLWVALLSFSTASIYAQTTAVAPAKTKTETTKTTAKKAEPKTEIAKKSTKKAEVKSGDTAASAAKSSSTPVKKDGTLDKRYKSNQHLKKDGTPDKRYSEHKTPPTQAPVVK